MYCLVSDANRMHSGKPCRSIKCNLFCGLPSSSWCAVFLMDGAMVNGGDAGGGGSNWGKCSECKYHRITLNTLGLICALALCLIASHSLLCIYIYDSHKTTFVLFFIIFLRCCWNFLNYVSTELEQKTLTRTSHLILAGRHDENARAMCLWLVSTLLLIIQFLITL